MLKISNLHYAYLNNKVLYGVEMCLEDSKIYCLAGHNGSGKTTIINLLTNILKLQEGSINYNNLEMNDFLKQREIYYIASDFYLPEYFSGREYLKFMACLYQVSFKETEVQQLCELFKIKNRLSDLISEYSYGMKRKLQLICAFLLKRQLLILDETLSGLDLEALIITKKLLRRYVRGGKVILFATHDLHLAEQLCDEVFILRSGIIVANGTIEKLKCEYKRSFEELFLYLSGLNYVK